jgi:hypothetical protein
MFSDLVSSRRPLHGEQSTADPSKGEAPPSEPVQRSDGSRGDVVGRDPGGLLRSPPMNGDIRKIEIFDDFVKERGTPSQRLDQGHSDVGPSDSEHDPG